jgi:hypothetical protein
MSATLKAYDYKEQKWVTGEKALPVLLNQLRQEEQILQGPRAGEYLAFGPVEERMSVEQALTKCRREIARLEGGQS